MVVWEIVEAPHGRYNRLAAERLASSILAEAIDNLIDDITTVEIVRMLSWF